MDQAALCEEMELCATHRNVAKKSEYSEDVCGYPSVLVFDFPEDEFSLSVFGHKVVTNIEKLEKYINHQLSGALSAHSIGGSGAADVSAFLTYVHNTRDAMPRHLQTTPLQRLSDGLKSLDYMLTIAVTSGVTRYSADKLVCMNPIPDYENEVCYTVILL